MKTRIVFLSISVMVGCLLFNGCQSRHIPNNSQQNTGDEVETVETLPCRNEDTGERVAAENEGENDVILSEFAEMLSDNMYSYYDISVSHDACQSVTGLTPSCPAYLPDNFRQYDEVFIEGNEFIHHYWYNTQDYAILAINEFKTARLPDPNDESGKYLYVDLVYPHDGFQHAAMRDEVVDGVEIQGYMLFAEESYEPECRKIIDSIFDAVDMED